MLSFLSKGVRLSVIPLRCSKASMTVSAYKSFGNNRKVFSHHTFTVLRKIGHDTQDHGTRSSYQKGTIGLPNEKSLEAEDFLTSEVESITVEDENKRNVKGSPYLFEINVTGACHQMRIDRLLCLYFPTLSFSTIMKLIKKKRVRIVYDGKLKRIKRINDLVPAGAVLQIPKEFEAQFQEDISVPADKQKIKVSFTKDEINDMIIYSDTNMLVLNKPYGLTIKEGFGHPSLIEIARGIKSDEPDWEFLSIYFLDRLSTGVTILVKNRKIFKEITDACPMENVNFRGLVVGSPPGKGSIAIPITWKTLHGVEKMCLRKDLLSVSPKVYKDFAKLTISHYKEVAHYGSLVALMEFKVARNAKKHVIRAHMADFVGNPIVGDPKYGHTLKENLTEVIGRSPRLCLHADRVTLNIPNGPPIEFTASYPEHFATILRKLDFHDNLS